MYYSTSKLLLSGPSWTGIGLAIILVLVTTVSVLPWIRRKNHELYEAVHLLLGPFYLILLFHGAYCFTQSDGGVCTPPVAWQFLVGPCVLFAIEQWFRWWGARHDPLQVLAVRQHAHTGADSDTDVIELQFLKPGWMRKGQWNYRVGQYLYLQCPEISRRQWHPLYVTSSMFFFVCFRLAAVPVAVPVKLIPSCM